jgi:hypothetical protein
MYTFIAKDLIVSTDSISTNEVNKEDATKNDDKTWPEGTNNEYIANGNDSSEQGARRYYSEHKNEDPVPICIDIAPVFVSDTDNPSYKISTTIELINNLSNFTIDFCKVTIIDDELKQYVSGLNKPVNISTTYSLEKDNNNGAAISYYSMTLPNGVGNAINKYLESTNGDYVECEMEFSYSVTRDGQSCTGPAENPKKTKLYFGNKLQKVYTTNNDSMITESKTRN